MGESYSQDSHEDKEEDKQEKIIETLPGMEYMFDQTFLQVLGCTSSCIPLSVWLPCQVLDHTRLSSSLIHPGQGQLMARVTS